jgi:hypothetical protein
MLRARLLAGGGPRETLSDDEAVDRLRSNDPLARLQALKPGTRLPRTTIFHGAVDEALKRAGADVALELSSGVGHAV